MLGPFCNTLSYFVKHVIDHFIFSRQPSPAVEFAVMAGFSARNAGPDWPSGARREALVAWPADWPGESDLC